MRVGFYRESCRSSRSSTDLVAVAASSSRPMTTTSSTDGSRTTSDCNIQWSIDGRMSTRAELPQGNTSLLSVSTVATSTSIDGPVRSSQRTALVAFAVSATTFRPGRFRNKPHSSRSMFGPGAHRTIAGFADVSLSASTLSSGPATSIATRRGPGKRLSTESALTSSHTPARGSLVSICESVGVSGARS